jgi:hypothetical protein
MSEIRRGSSGRKLVKTLAMIKEKTKADHTKRGK